MKLTKSKLQQIIKEELGNVLGESTSIDELVNKANSEMKHAKLTLNAPYDPEYVLEGDSEINYTMRFPEFGKDDVGNMDLVTELMDQEIWKRIGEEVGVDTDLVLFDTYRGFIIMNSPQLNYPDSERESFVNVIEQVKKLDAARPQILEMMKSVIG